jgi:hypothetical protein
LTSLANSADAVLVLSGNGYGTSPHPLVWHKCPYPTVGRPMGSGEGEATKPSNSLMRERVAAFTGGPVHARDDKGDERVVVRKVESARSEVGKCMLKDGS